MMTILTRASNGQSISLGKQIASSGEGEVWETNLSGYLAKIYHNPTPERIKKLEVMLANPPADPMLNLNHISIAWPKDLLKDQGGAAVGFLMPAIRQSRELPSIYNPRLRKRNAPGFNWYYLHATALNTAWIIQEIHAKGYVLGDIKPQNILVNDRALVAVFDTDSFQVRDEKTGTVYRCTVGSEGFTPVELLGKDFSVTDQTEVHDRFRLAVMIHYLLFGYHPFSGEWIGSGESPEQTELLKRGFWPYGQNSLIRASLNTIPLDVVHPELKKCFLNCFNDGHTAPHLRPTAEEWHNALQVAVNELTVCDKVDSHHYSRNYGKCYWCLRTALLGVDIFPGRPGTAKVPTATGSSKVAADKSLESIFPSLFGTAVTTVKSTTNPSKATPTVLSSASSQSSKQLASQSLNSSSPPTPSSQPSLRSKKAAITITSSVMGLWILISLFATRPQTQSTQPLLEPSVAQQNISSVPEGSPLVESSRESSMELTEPPSDSTEPTDSSVEPIAPSNSASEPTSSPTLQRYQQFSPSDFPKASCGDPLPSNSSDYTINFFPVFVPYSDDNLAKVRYQFCQDAFKRRRKDTGEIVVQVSSFTSQEKAREFANFIISEFEYVIVGKPTVVNEKNVTVSPNSTSFFGVGLVLSKKNGSLTVVQLIKGSPASKAGIRVGDHILAVDGQATAYMSDENAVSLIRGEANTDVTLSLKREGKGLFNLKLARTLIIDPNS